MSGEGKRLQVLLCGVGGQGVIFAAELLGRELFGRGHLVTVGQAHGMSQRGGSVESFVLAGALEAALLDGPPDVLLALEPLEAARAAPRLGATTTAIVNTRRVAPYELTRDGKRYPDEDGLLGRVRARAGRVLHADVTSALEQAALARGTNLAMLGALSALGALEAFGVGRDALAAALDADGARAFALGAGLRFHDSTTVEESDDGLQARH